MKGVHTLSKEHALPSQGIENHLKSDTPPPPKVALSSIFLPQPVIDTPSKSLPSDQEIAQDALIPPHCSSPILLHVPPPPRTNLPPAPPDIRPSSTFSELLAKKRHALTFTTENPKQLFITDNLLDAFALKKVLKVGEEGFAIYVLFPGVELDTVAWKKSAAEVILIVSHLDRPPSPCLVQWISYFLAQKHSVKLVMNAAERHKRLQPFAQLVLQRRGCSKAARMISKAVSISNVEDITCCQDPLQVVLQRIRERSVTPHNLSIREAPEHRLLGAARIYQHSELVSPGNIVDVNLKLRGITQTPACMRAALLKHPDLSAADNERFKQAQDSKVGILQSLKQGPSLEKRIIHYDDAYWVVLKDERGPDGVHLHLSNPDYTCRLVIHEQSATICDKTRKHEEAPVTTFPIANPDEMIQVCTFKWYVRLVPYHEEGVLQGIERAFFNPNAGSLRLEGSHYKKVRYKLARGKPSGASVVFHEEGIPLTEIRGEGVENVLSALEALRRLPGLAQRMGLTSGNDAKTDPWNCRINACIGVNDLVRMPVDPRTRTIIIVADNDGHNAETHQTLIETVSHLLKRGLCVKIAFPSAQILGKKCDLNDILVERGVAAVGDVLQHAIEIKNVEEISPPWESLQLQLSPSLLLAQIRTSLAEHHPTLYMRLGDAYSRLRRYEAADHCYETGLKGLREMVQEQTALGAELYLRSGQNRIYLKQIARAQVELHKAIDIDATVSQNAPTLLKTSALRALAELYLSQRDSATALAQCNQSLSAVRTILAAHPNRGEALSVLASVYDTMGRIYSMRNWHSKAIETHQKALAINKEIAREGYSLEIVHTLGALADAYFEEKEYTLAAKLYDEILVMQQKIFCSERFGVDQEFLVKIAKTFARAGKYPSALQHYVRYLHPVKQESLPPTLKLLIRRAIALSREEKEKERRAKSFLSEQPVNQKNEEIAPYIRPRAVGFVITNKQCEEVPLMRSALPPTKMRRMVSVPSPHAPTYLTRSSIVQQRFPYWCPKPGVRQVAIDVETTGFSHRNLRGRITEIACVEVEGDGVFHAYVNPDTAVGPVAHKITGLTWNFLKKFPRFSAISAAFLEFISGAELIVHDATSDLLFLNSELERAGYLGISLEKNHRIIDTFEMARELHPRGQRSLDALCQIYGVDNSARVKHGAEIDAQLLKQVYEAMIRGEIVFNQEGQESFSGVIEKF